MAKKLESKREKSKSKKESKELRSDKKKAGKTRSGKKARLSWCIGAGVAVVVAGVLLLPPEDFKLGLRYKLRSSAVHRQHQVKAHNYLHRDSYYDRFEGFLDSKLSDLEIKALIEKETGLHLAQPEFRISDEYGLTKTERFYDFGVVLNTYPLDFKPWLEKIPRLIDIIDSANYCTELSCNTNSGYFDTAQNKDYECVIRNLGCYLRAKAGSDNPRVVVQYIAGWVSDNLPPFIDKNKEDKLFSVAGRDHSFTDSREILKNEALCLDYTNLFVDICNCLGIPAREISLASTIIVFDKKKLPDKWPESINNSYHSIAEVRLPDVLYIDPSRGGSYSILFDNPMPYFYDLSNEHYPGGFVSHVNIHGSVPNHMVPERIKAAVDNDRFHFFSKEFLSDYHSFLKNERNKVISGKESFHFIYNLDAFKEVRK